MSVATGTRANIHNRCRQLNMVDAISCLVRPRQCGDAAAVNTDTTTAAASSGCSFLFFLVAVEVLFVEWVAHAHCGCVGINREGHYSSIAEEKETAAAMGWVVLDEP